MFIGLGSIDPTDRLHEAQRRLAKAERAVASAEDELIKARREMKDATDAWHKVHDPRQSDTFVRQ